MQVKIANLPDRPVRYLESGAGRALVLLHAFPLSADQWLPQLHRLPPGWRAVAADFRGFQGGTYRFEPLGLESATMDSHAGDVLALMAHLAIDRAVVVGLSMGGYVAFALLRRAPQSISGLVLANTRATADSADGLAARDRMIALAEQEGARGVAREMLPKLLGETSRREQPDLVQVVEDLIGANDAAGLVSALRAMKMRPDSSALLSTVECPTMIVSGEEDMLIPESDVDAMRQAIPGAAHVRIARAGHLTNLEAPAAFNDALSKFLYALPPAA